MRTLLLIFLCSFCFSLAYATPTKVVVRAKAKDAKFIGNSVGGAYVIIRNQATKEILAQGKTDGSTGNTNHIMREPWDRGGQLSDENTSKFVAEIDIDEPVFVDIEVLAPFNKKQATVAASTSLWLIPGKDILGDGVILEIPGFIIDILKPRTHQFIAFESLEDKNLSIEANIVMMCGCTISNGGLWDANQMEVKAVVKKNNKPYQEVDLKIASPNLFDGQLAIDGPGNYELLIYAYSESTGNTGVDKVNYIITN